MKKKTSPYVNVRDVIRRRHELNDLYRRNTQPTQARQKRRFDEKTASAKDNTVADYVWVFFERSTTERNKETPIEMEGTVHDNGSASGGTFL